jgi:threonyl-tRNA synthetase
MPSVILPDDSRVEFQDGATAADVAARLGSGLARAALAARVSLDGGKTWQIQDLRRPLPEHCHIQLLTGGDDPDALFVIRHSAAHVMAEAICKLYPGTKLVYGPPVEDGFYYDIELDQPITPENFAAIEEEMQRIIAEDRSFTRVEMSRAAGLEKVRREGNRYKVDNAERAEGDLSFYVTGARVGQDFEDLCRGPHLPSTGRIKAFKLTQVSGAYYRGDQNEQQLQRIYGTAFADKKALAAYLERLEEARKRDHRKLGPQLDLFHIQEEAPGAVFWHPKGWTLYQAVVRYIRDLLARHGYQEINTPQLVDKSLWEKSGHWDKFRENMFSTETEARHFAIKPMNCPCHIQVFKQGLRSYRDLPLRLAEFGGCHRNEPSGTLHGLMRVRAFTQDDAHIFCTPAQIGSEVAAFCDLVKTTYTDFGFQDIVVNLSTRPENRVGADEVWDKAEAALHEALKSMAMAYEVAPGEGAFYGPKVDFKVRDCLGRLWQLGTVQLDFSMPGRLGARYVGEDNAPHTPVMLHRAICGSLERFLGILIEHYAGAFPLWLAPTQAAIVTISEKSVDYAHEVHRRLVQGGLRSQADVSSERIGPKKQKARDQKVPYILVVGEQEAARHAVNVNNREGVTLGTVPVEEFIKGCSREIASKGREDAFAQPVN